MIRINEATLELIKQWEGCKLEAYRDVAGVWTIGWGHTTMAGPPTVIGGLKITQARADEIFDIDLNKVAERIRPLIKVPVNDNQFGACLSLAFNVGEDIDLDTKAEGFGDSTLLRKLNYGDYEGAAGEFKKWVFAGGKKVKGLENRRADEVVLFNTPVTTPVVAPPLTPEQEVGFDMVLKWLFVLGSVAAVLGLVLWAIL
jgi:lysozyme